jgi:hypothetical protein
MEINLTAEQEAQLSQLAAQEGKGAHELAREVLLRGLDLEVTLTASRSRNILTPLKADEFLATLNKLNITVDPDSSNRILTDT